MQTTFVAIGAFRVKLIGKEINAILGAQTVLIWTYVKMCMVDHWLIQIINIRFNHRIELLVACSCLTLILTHNTRGHKNSPWVKSNVDYLVFLVDCNS